MAATRLPAPSSAPPSNGPRPVLPCRNIVVCSDGTGNSDVKGRGTNVFKLYEAVDRHGPQRQIAFYDDGVGTEALKPLRLFAGAFGWGLTRNVKQLYTELCRAYQPGDRIFMFGFSRGAFTVRTLGGLVTSCGIIDARAIPTASELDRRVDRAYAAYRRRYVSQAQRMLGRRSDQAPSRRHRENEDVHDGVSIAFLGVWDTVDAVGLPFAGSAEALNMIYRFKFPDHSLSPHVRRACHALSIDDERLSFHPLLWDLRGDPEPERVRQVWFAGVHANVGGGYPKQGVSLTALDWMMHEAELEGLRFLEPGRSLARNAHDVHDKIYDSRAGPAAYYRYGPRDLERMSREAGTPFRIHVSALERLLQGTYGYAPGNLPPEVVVVHRPVAPGALAEERRVVLWDPDDAEDARRARRVERLRDLRVWTQHLFYAASGMVLLLPFLRQAGVRGLGIAAVIDPATYVNAFRDLARSAPAAAFLIGLVGAVSYVAGWWAERRMKDTNSQFWHRHGATLGPFLAVAGSSPAPAAPQETPEA